MAADILLYKPKYVPVNEDQKQHIELCRNICQRFNGNSKEVFGVPNPLIAEKGCRIKDLQNPDTKMSKSAQNPNGTLFMNDSNKQISKKIKSAITDSGNEIIYSENKPGLRNLLEIYSLLTNKEVDHIVEEYKGKMYGHLKQDLAEIAINKI